MRHRQYVKQHGVYAVEWAIVFPVFFVLVYAIVSYGLVFLVRESMQNAVEDGARAALRYQTMPNARLAMAKAVVQQNLAWLPESLHPGEVDIQVTVCRFVGVEACIADLECKTEDEHRCLINVQLHIPYGENPLAPAIPGLGFLIPSVLTASASALIGSEGLWYAS